MGRYPSRVDFALAPEDEAFRDELRAWLDEHLPPFFEAEALAEDASLSGEASQKRRQAWQRKLNEGGWAAIHWGPEYGGRTINAMQRLIYSEVMAEYRTPGIFNTNGIWQIGPMIIAWGTDEQKAQWLPSILDAEEHWCQGFSEPDAGNDLANLRTLAIYDEATTYVINGSKIWISSAHLATWGLFLLRTDPTAIERGKKHEGITAFIFNLKTPGIEVRPIRDMAGEELFNEIFFTDARIPASWRLGDEGDGWMVAMGTLGYERVGIASQISILSADLRAVVEAARSVNPGALADPSLRDRMAKVWTEIELARLLSLRALSKIMKGEKNWPEVPFAKLSWSSLAQTLAELAVDLLGPAGMHGPRRPRLRSTGASGPASTPSSATARSAAARPRSRRTSSPTGPSPCPGSRAPPEHVADPRSPCLIGVARRTWHPADVPDGAPEPLAMWEEMARAAAADAGARPEPTCCATREHRRRLLPVVAVRRRGGPPGRAPGGRTGPPPATRASAARCPRCWPPTLAQDIVAGHLDLGPHRRRRGAGHRAPAQEGRPDSRSGRSRRPKWRPLPHGRCPSYPSEISHAVFRGLPDLCALRQRTPGAPRAEPGRTPGETGRGAGLHDRGGGGQPARLVPRRPHAPRRSSRPRRGTAWWPTPIRS